MDEGNMERWGHTIFNTKLLWFFRLHCQFFSSKQILQKRMIKFYLRKWNLWASEFTTDTRSWNMWSIFWRWLEDKNCRQDTHKCCYCKGNCRQWTCESKVLQNQSKGMLLFFCSGSIRISRMGGIGVRSIRTP